MRRLLPVFAFALVSLAAGAAPVAAAPNEYHACPPEARGAVTHNGDAEWTATTQSSRLMDLRITTIGSQVALVCVYHMFGGEYWIYSRPSPSFPNCTVRSGNGRPGFYCLGA